MKYLREKKYIKILCILYILSFLLVPNGLELFAQSREELSQNIQSIFRTDEYNQSLEKIEHIDIKSDDVKTSLVQDLPRSIKSIQTSFESDARNFFYQKTGYADGFSEDSIKSIFEDFFKKIKNQPEYSKNLNENIKKSTFLILSKHINLLKKDIKSKLDEAFRNFDSTILAEIKKELESDLLNISSGAENAFNAEFETQFKLKNFGATLFLPVLTKGLKMVASGAFKSAIQRILGKALARSLAIPGEWLGPLGWAVEGIAVVGGVAWDTLSIRDKTVEALTITAKDTFYTYAVKPLENEDSDVLTNIVGIYNNYALNLISRTKIQIQEKWSGRLVHTRSPDWESFVKAFPEVKDQLVMLDTVANVFGNDCSAMDFKVKYTFANAFTPDKARNYFQKFGEKFPSLVYSHRVAVEKILLNFDEMSKQVINNILAAQNETDQRKLISDADTFIDCFPKPDAELKELFIFLTEHKIEFDYTNLNISRARFLGKHLKSLSDLIQTDPALVGNFFSTLPTSTDDQLQIIGSAATNFKLPEILSIIQYAGFANTCKLLKEVDSAKAREFFNNYGYENGGNMIGIYGPGLIEAYSIKDADPNRSVEVWKKLPANNTSKELETTAIWVLQNTTWKSDEITLPLLNQLKSNPIYYSLNIPVFGLLMATLVKTTNSTFIPWIFPVLGFVLFVWLLKKLFWHGNDSARIVIESSYQNMQPDGLIVKSGQAVKSDKTEQIPFKNDETKEDV